MVDFNEDEDSMIDALRSIGSSGHKGAVLNMLGKAMDLKNAEPSLGEDNFDILSKSSSNSTKAYEKLKRKHQVDLNDAKQLNEIEDGNLQEHMMQARKRLAEYEVQSLKLPELSSLLNLDTDVRKTLSQLTVSLNDQQMMLRVSCDNVILQSTYAHCLSVGECPHGHQKNNTYKSFETLSGKLAVTGDHLSNTVIVFEAFSRDLAVTRRTYENIVDGLLKRVKHFEASYLEMQELQKMQKM